MKIKVKTKITIGVVAVLLIGAAVFASSELFKGALIGGGPQLRPAVRPVALLPWYCQLPPPPPPAPPPPNGDAAPPPPPDMCPNIAGIQDVVPPGMIKNNVGDCVVPDINIVPPGNGGNGGNGGNDVAVGNGVNQGAPQDPGDLPQPPPENRQPPQPPPDVRCGCGEKFRIIDGVKTRCDTRPSTAYCSQRYACPGGSRYDYEDIYNRCDPGFDASDIFAICNGGDYEYLHPANPADMRVCKAFFDGDAGMFASRAHLETQYCPDRQRCDALFAMYQQGVVSGVTPFDDFYAYVACDLAYHQPE